MLLQLLQLKVSQFFRDELFKQIVLLELGQVTPEDAFKDFKVQVELNVDEDEVVFELNE